MMCWVPGTTSHTHELHRLLADLFQVNAKTSLQICAENIIRVIKTPTNNVSIVYTLSDIPLFFAALHTGTSPAVPAMSL